MLALALEEVIIKDELPVLAAAADDEVTGAALLEATTADEEAGAGDEAPAAEEAPAA